MPLYIFMLAALMAGGRLVHAGGAVAQAAGDAARQASIARTAGQARAAATASALATLRQKGLHCSPQVTLDVAAFSRRAGQGATVTARVSCTVRMSDIALLGIPGSRTVTKTHRSPLDPYRGR
jgi:Flp pilus assembly protein TadG